MKKNDLIELEITDISNDGNGVGRFFGDTSKNPACGQMIHRESGGSAPPFHTIPPDQSDVSDSPVTYADKHGMAVFVPFTAPGDRLICRIARVQKSYAFGIMDSLVASSALRRENDCPDFGKCGGCSLRHLDYRAECAVKQGWVTGNMKRIGKTDAAILPILPSPCESRYRNKAIYPIALVDGEVATGFYARRSHRVIPHSDCLLQPRLFTDIRDRVVDFLRRHAIPIYDEATHRGLVRGLFLRMGEVTGEVMVCLVVNGDTLPHADTLVSELVTAFPQIKTVLLNINTRQTNVVLGAKNRILSGSGTITDALCGLRFALSPQSFYQVNRAATEKLYAVAAGYAGLTGHETLLDLYCGVGTIGLSMADRAGQVIGVEIVPEAVENARANAAANQITNARFIVGDAAEAAEQLAAEGIRPDVVVVDPPRKGLTPALIDTIVGMAPRRVVMVSCDSATAARDVALFAAQGYVTREVQPVDMFPRSAHVETVALLSKLKSATSIEVKINLDEMDLTQTESKATYDEI